MTKKRVRSVPIYVWVRPEELVAIQERMAEAGIQNFNAYVRKMALNGYVLHVDLSDIWELVSLQRRCANNLNQMAIQASTYGASTPRRLPYSRRTMRPCGGHCPTCSKSCRK